jgi:flavodoxin
MNRKRDLRAPKDITDEQRRFISRRPRLVELRRERKQLHVKMVALYGSMRKAGDTEIYKRHKELGQQISRLRDQFRREERLKAK